MKRGLRTVRCPAAKASCREFAVPPPADAAFSLIELLFVMVLVLVLTTLYWSSGSDNGQKRRNEECQKNLQKIFVAMEIYANEHSGKFPARAGAMTSEEPLDMLVPHYTVDTSVFTCPGSQDPALPSGESLQKGKISYAYFMGRQAADGKEALMSDRLVDTNPKITGQNVFSSNGKPPGNNHSKYGGNFLFCDGHVEHSPAAAPFSIILTQGVVLLNPK